MSGAGGLVSGSIFRVLKACTTCKTQELASAGEAQGEEEIAEEEKVEEEALEPPQTRVGKV